MKIELNRDWTEFLSALISRRVRFVIVGGHAVAGHGEPRLTEDLDVFVERSPANARKIRQALVDFGFGIGRHQPFPRSLYPFSDRSECAGRTLGGRSSV